MSSTPDVPRTSAPPFVSTREGSSPESTLLLVGGIILISQVAILLVFNLGAYLIFPSGNPQSLLGSAVFGIEAALIILMLIVWFSASAPSRIRSPLRLLPLISVLAVIALDEYLTVPAMNGPPTQLLIQVLSVLVIPADNYIMGVGIILILIGSGLILSLWRKSKGPLRPGDQTQHS